MEPHSRIGRLYPIRRMEKGEPYMEKLQTFWVEIVFGLTIILSLLTQNKTMGFSAAIVLGLRLLHGNRVLELLASKGVNWGILLLTVAIFAPLALDHYKIEQLYAVIRSPAGWISILAGILVTVLGTKGVETSTTSVTIVLGVTLGSVVGVVLFRGTPMGPMIGSGMASVGILIAKALFKL